MAVNTDKNKPAIVIGVMSGTSCDGLDIAVSETDGDRHIRTLGGESFEFDTVLREKLLNAGKLAVEINALSAEAHPDIQSAAADFTAFCADRLSEYVTQYDAALIGFHGQTILHRPDKGFTIQIGNAAFLAERLNVPVVCHFRAADVAAGGQGAPLVPLYHAALLRTKETGLPNPITWVNVGGVANVTYIDLVEDKIIACDTGPGNGLSDSLTRKYFSLPYDKDGLIAKSGNVCEQTLQTLLAHPYFTEAAPKSLDRHDFTIEAFEGLEPTDAIATATAFAAHALIAADALYPQPPKIRVISGGGAHNPAFMRSLQSLSAAPVITCAEIGFNTDLIEAECFAWLAARSLRGLPLSLPTTTGVSKPCPGGKVIHPPAAVARSK